MSWDQQKQPDAAFFRGKTIVAIAKIDDERIEFQIADGKKYAILHHQDCCESVSIFDISGELTDLIGMPLFVAMEQSLSMDSETDEWPSDVPNEDRPSESWTWTIFNFETVKAAVRIRWLGSSNGYYGESASINEIE